MVRNLRYDGSSSLTEGRLWPGARGSRNLLDKIICGLQILNYTFIIKISLSADIFARSPSSGLERPSSGMTPERNYTRRILLYSLNHATRLSMTHNNG
jgi:hypothetical protein